MSDRINEQVKQNAASIQAIIDNANELSKVTKRKVMQRKVLKQKLWNERYEAKSMKWKFWSAKCETTVMKRKFGITSANDN